MVTSEGETRDLLEVWDLPFARKGGTASEEEEIRRALGVESADGFHVEGRKRRLRIRVADPERTKTDKRSFPCLRGHTYTGCTGTACPLQTCWTGAATPGSLAAQTDARLSAPLYLPGAPCHRCACLREDSIPVEGREPVERVQCTRGLWAHPVSLSSFVRKRIPMIDQDEPQNCPGFVAAPAPHPAVVAHLQHRREQRWRQKHNERSGGD